MIFFRNKRTLGAQGKNKHTKKKTLFSEIQHHLHKIGKVFFVQEKNYEPQIKENGDFVGNAEAS